MEQFDGNRNVRSRSEYKTLLTRHPANPILTSADWPYPVNAVFNAGAVRLGG